MFRLILVFAGKYLLHTFFIQFSGEAFLISTGATTIITNEDDEVVPAGTTWCQQGAVRGIHSQALRAGSGAVDGPHRSVVRAWRNEGRPGARSTPIRQLIIFLYRALLWPLIWYVLLVPLYRACS